jgi:hypothetical protein
MVNVLQTRDPIWVQASRVVATKSPNYFHIYVGQKDYGIHKASSGQFLDSTKVECLVEDPESGWIRIWWDILDVESL